MSSEECITDNMRVSQTDDIIPSDNGILSFTIVMNSTHIIYDLIIQENQIRYARPQGRLVYIKSMIYIIVIFGILDHRESFNTHCFVYRYQ